MSIRFFVSDIVGQDRLDTDIRDHNLPGFATPENLQHRNNIGFESLLDIHRLAGCGGGIKRVVFMTYTNINLC